MKRLPVPHLGRPGEFEGDGLDALSPEVGEESQGIEPGVLRAVFMDEGGGEVLVEDHEFDCQRGQILLALGEKIGGRVVGRGENDAVGRSGRRSDEGLEF